MSPSKICLFALFACLAVSGCDSRQQKHQKQQAADLKAATERAEQAAEQLEQAKAASKEVSPEQPSQDESRATIKNEFEQLMGPYLDLNNQLLELGGIDAVTLSSIQDVDNRIAMIQKLSIMNDQIDIRFPELFMQVTGSDSPEGKRQLAMAKQVRQADREAYPHMMKSLQIVRKYWDTSGNANDGLFYFGDNVPKDEVLIYNQHLEAIDAIGKRQEEIQSEYYIEP